MKKYIARQIDPDYQAPYMFNSWDDWEAEYPGFSVYGNSDYRERLHGELAILIENDALEQASWEFEALETEGAEVARLCCVEEIIEEYIGKEYITSENAEAWESILRDYYKCKTGHKKDAILCRALEVMTGEEYVIEEIHGSAQSEWVECCHPEMYGAEYFEIEYFNMGTEWEVSDNPVMVDMEDRNLFDTADEVLNGAVSTYRVYCHSHNTESIRDEIADNLGVKPEEVLMWAFKGYRKIADYEMI